MSQVEPRATTMRFQGAMNRVMRALLATPGVSQGIGSKLITVYVTGRKSGKKYTVPVAYEKHEGTLLIGTPFAWARNLRTGEPVEVRYLGRRRQAQVVVHTEEAEVVEYYGVLARNNPSFASFNRIERDATGEPSPADLHLAWAAGARVIQLTL